MSPVVGTRDFALITTPHESASSIPHPKAREVGARMDGFCEFVDCDSETAYIGISLA